MENKIITLQILSFPLVLRPKALVKRIGQVECSSHVVARWVSGLSNWIQSTSKLISSWKALLFKLDI